MVKVMVRELDKNYYKAIGAVYKALLKGMLSKRERAKLNEKMRAIKKKYGYGLK